MIQIQIDESHVPDDHERYSGERELAAQILQRIDAGDIGQHYDLTKDNVTVTIESETGEWRTSWEQTTDEDS